MGSPAHARNSYGHQLDHDDHTHCFSVGIKVTLQLLVVMLAVHTHEVTTIKNALYESEQHVRPINGERSNSGRNRHSPHHQHHAHYQRDSSRYIGAALSWENSGSRQIPREEPQESGNED